MSVLSCRFVLFLIYRNFLLLHWLYYPYERYAWAAFLGFALAITAYLALLSFEAVYMGCFSWVYLSFYRLLDFIISRSGMYGRIFLDLSQLLPPDWLHYPYKRYIQTAFLGFATSFTASLVSLSLEAVYMDCFS